jgi:hypothetical protein
VSQVSISQRLREAQELVRGIDRHLLLGSGLGATLPNGYVRSTSDPWSFELTYYQLLFELGIIGLSAVLALPVTLIARSWRGLAGTSVITDVPRRVAIGAMLALVVADSTNPYLINSVGMLAVAVVCAIAELPASREPDPGEKHEQPHRESAQIAPGPV